LTYTAIRMLNPYRGYCGCGMRSDSSLLMAQSIISFVLFALVSWASKLNVKSAASNLSAVIFTIPVFVIITSSSLIGVTVFVRQCQSPIQ